DVVLGRDPAAADVVFGPEDRLVSRRHASLRVTEDAVLLRDLESSTGTFVDGEDVEEAQLRHGDVFELGPGGPRWRREGGDARTRGVGGARPPPDQPPRAPPAPPPLRPHTRLVLSFLSGSRAGASLELAGAVVRIGRAPGSTVSTPGDRVVS